MPTYNNTVTGDENAIEGTSVGGRGIVGKSETNYGIRAHSKKLSGTRSSSEEGVGVEGESNTNHGVVGVSKGAGCGVKAVSKDGEALHAETNSLGSAAIAAYNLNSNGTGAAIYAKKDGTNGPAGFFEGNVHVTGDITIGGDITLLNAADCAEDFDIAGVENVEPGTVMVLGEEGALHQSQQAYDKRVAGVLSGAGDYKAGIVLDKQQAKDNRKPIALLGKVFCKVDADAAPVEVGDLLTTSDTLGHAMKATDHLKAFGAVIGKALRPLKGGQGMIPILIALQ